jgi:DNA-binding protein
MIYKREIRNSQLRYLFDDRPDSGICAEPVPLDVKISSMNVSADEMQVINIAAEVTLAYEKKLTQALMSGRQKGKTIGKNIDTAEKVVDRLMPESTVSRKCIIMGLARRVADSMGGDAHSPYRISDEAHGISRRKRRSRAEMLRDK